MRLAYSLMLMTLATTALAADEPKAADGDAPLPVGWPSGTKPGVIEVKNYPAYRSAVARAKGATTRSDGVLFFSLFNHISRKDIAMTAPVVNTYDSAMIDDPRKQGDLSMEFLYQSPTQGQAGQGVGAVKVEDHPAATFVCRGVQGEMNPERLKIEMDEVKKWLTDHKGEWEQAGEPRRLGYHGPMTPVKKRLWEVQIPIRKVGSAK